MVLAGYFHSSSTIPLISLALPVCFAFMVLESMGIHIQENLWRQNSVYGVSLVHHYVVRQFNSLDQECLEFWFIDLVWFWDAFFCWDLLSRSGCWALARSKGSILPKNYNLAQRLRWSGEQLIPIFSINFIIYGY